MASMGILIQTTGLLYVFPYSLTASLSMRIGQELGAEAPVQGKLYTCEPEVLALTYIVLPILGFCELVSIFAAFKFKMGFLGLWFGFAVAQVTCMCMVICTLVFTGCKHQGKRAKELT
ncbi:hypothetical protein GOBAR_AA02404 [Gossypium barbadense]|uniref:Uncharacterized protein n=1 Tax=Gossypium barbadense TaxID=3634 RepID=A0A2P5YRH2_GOSBA|nr:hypothetical protein GOBAR_AA02404 [Gossypium barbadense]